MRRNTLRLAIALVATSLLAACADLSTGPAAPRGPQLEAGFNSGQTTDSTTSRANHQGSST